MVMKCSIHTVSEILGCLLLVHLIICIYIKKLTYMLTVLGTLPDKPALQTFFVKGRK